MRPGAGGGASRDRERGRAELMGELTYGKSTVQYLNQLSDGSGLRVTVAQWHTPDGDPIPTTGLTPDRPFPALEAANPSPEQLLEAIARQFSRDVLAGAVSHANGG